MTIDHSIEEPCEVTSLTHGFEAERRGRPLRLGSILRSGAQWAELPAEEPPYQTCHRRFQRWVRAGTLERLLDALARDLKGRGKLDLSEGFIDGTF